jgi:hypothetical protein
MLGDKSMHRADDEHVDLGRGRAGLQRRREKGRCSLR